ncbi:transposase domain-containing protein [Pseudomonas sp. SDO55104_S430]
MEWIAYALEFSRRATIRRRRLFADQVLWLVIGVALFRDEPAHEVARRLIICPKACLPIICWRAVVSLKPQRLRAGPVEWLYRKFGTHWGTARYDGDN